MRNLGCRFQAQRRSLAESDRLRPHLAPRFDQTSGWSHTLSGSHPTTQEDEHREAHVPAKSASPSQEARFPCTDEHPSRTCRAQVAPRQGPRPSLRLIHRIRTRAEFERLERSGRRVRNELLWCSHRPDSSTCPPRVAFAIGRAHGPAVARNRLRRRLKPILASLATDGIVPPGHLLVGINRSMTAQVFATSATELRQQVMDLMSKLASRPVS